MDSSKKRNGFSLRSNITRSLRGIASGFFILPAVSSLEGFFLRLLFGIVVAFTISLNVPFPTQPHPAGLAHIFDLTWLSDPDNLRAYRNVIYLLVSLYVAGLLLPIVLPALAVGHALMFTLFNSQGYTHHGYQIVSLTLLAQAVTVLYYTALKGIRLQPPDSLLNAWLFVQSQVVVVGAYLVSFLTKMFATGGMWFWNANYVAIDLIKTQRQHYYSRLDPGDAGNPLEAMWLLEHPWISRGLFRRRRSSRSNRLSRPCWQKAWFSDRCLPDSDAPQCLDAHGTEVSVQRNAVHSFLRRDSLFRSAMLRARPFPGRAAWDSDWRGVGRSLELFRPACLRAKADAASRIYHQPYQFT